MDPIPVANELAFRVGFSGHSGHLRVEPLSTAEQNNPLRSIPDFVLVSPCAVPLTYMLSPLTPFFTLLRFSLPSYTSQYHLNCNLIFIVSLYFF